MPKAYHGKNTLSSIVPRHTEEVLIMVKTKPEDINFILKIVETHSHIAFAVQIEPHKGILGFHTTKDNQDELRMILESIPRHFKILS